MPDSHDPIAAIRRFSDQLGHWSRSDFHDFANKIGLLLGDREVDKYRYADIGRQLERIEKSVTELANYVRIQNGRTTTLEHKVGSLETSRVRHHGVQSPEDEIEAERRAVTRREVWLVLAAFGGGLSILKFLEWFSKLAK